MKTKRIISFNNENYLLPRISYLAFASVLRFAVQFLIIILYSNLLSLQLYGQYQYIWMYINFFNLMMVFGFSTLAMSTPLHEIKRWLFDHKKTITSFIILLNVVAISILFIRSSYFNGLQRSFLFLLLVLQNIIVVTEAVAIKKEREKNV